MAMARFRPGPIPQQAAHRNGCRPLTSTAMAGSISRSRTGAMARSVSCWGNGTSMFPARTDYRTIGWPDSIAVSDTNSDGKLDLVVANWSVGGKVSVLLGNGKGSFQAKVDYATSQLPRSMVLIDVNGD